MRELRAGLVGLGMMGRNHARVLQSTEGLRLVGVADPAGDPHGAAAGVRVHPSVDSLIAAGLDLCVVATPTEDHEPVGEALAAAGVHTLMEKPLATDTAAARRLVDRFGTAGLVGAVGHIERFNPALLQLRARLDGGALGEPYQVTTIRSGPFPGRVRDVGVIMDLATHDVDLTAWVVGSRFAAVSAVSAHRSGRRHEDLVVAIGVLANGVATNHQVNWLSPMKERRTVVTGERGAFVADTLTGDLTFYENGRVETTWDRVSSFRGVTEGNMTRYAFPKREPLATELEGFRDAVRGRPEAAVVTMREAVTSVRVAEAMATSASEGRRISIPSPSDDAPRRLN